MTDMGVEEYTPDAVRVGVVAEELVDDGAAGDVRDGMQHASNSDIPLARNREFDF